MNSQIAAATLSSTSRPPVGRGPVVCGIWLRVAFIGASAFAVGVTQLFGDDVKLLPALALTVASGLLTAFGVRRARGALNATDNAAPALELSARSPAGALAL